jgi:ribose/xylose/arabinose/galactoside ABC-type transport system permease subunit
MGKNMIRTVVSAIVEKKSKLFVRNGASAGAAALLGLSASLGSADPKSGDKWELQVIAAVVVGGTSLFGGKGTITGTFVGVLLIRVLAVGVNFLQVSRFYQYVVVGGVLLLAVLVDTLSKKSKS